MKETTKQRKKARKGMEEAYSRSWLTEHLFLILARGKQGFDSMMKDLGRMMAETIM